LKIRRAKKIDRQTICDTESIPLKHRNPLLDKLRRLICSQYPELVYQSELHKETDKVARLCIYTSIASCNLHLRNNCIQGYFSSALATTCAAIFDDNDPLVCTKLSANDNVGISDNSGLRDVVGSIGFRCCRQNASVGYFIERHGSASKRRSAASCDAWCVSVGHGHFGINATASTSRNSS
jgi:hypothetical protein